jgi:hypothetical protein
LYVRESNFWPEKRERGDVAEYSKLNLDSLGRGWRGHVTRVEEVDRMKDDGRAPPPSASWAENTIMTECT